MIDNRIINGGFDSGVLAPFTGSGVSIDSANSHTGSFSARLASGTSSGFISQLVPVSPGENFEFFVSLAKIGTNNSPQISIVVNYLNSSSQLLETALMVTIPSGRIPSTSSDNWLEIYKTTSVAPATTTQAQVVIFKVPQSTTANVVIDDVALLAVTGGSLGPIGNLNVGGDLSVNGSTQLGNSLSDLVNVAGSQAVVGDLFVGGNTVLGNTLSDTVEVRGSETVQGNLNVSGDTILQGDLTVNGNTNFTIDTLTTTGDFTVGNELQVNGRSEFQGITSFFGPFNVFVTPVFADNTLVVGGSEVIGSGSIQGGTLELSGFLGGGIVPEESLRVHNGHIALFGAGQGIILTAPNNTRWLLTVNNSGNLVTTPVS